MPRGLDPRANPASREDVPRLVREGVAHYGARRFWHAHEAWEGAWHALRAAGEAEAAEFLHGLILVAAALENATRGKEDGFKRQCAEGLVLLRTHAEAASRVTVARPDALLDALTGLYLDASRQRVWADWNASGWTAPELELSP